MRHPASRRSDLGRRGLAQGLLGLAAFAGPACAMATPRTKPASRLPPDLAGAMMTFNEEFSAFVANPNGDGGWKTRYFHGDRTLGGNNEAQFYADDTIGGSPFRVQDGVLEIAASRDQVAPGLPFRSGLLNSQTIFSQRLGYFEMRAQLPAGRGLWPAFWMLPNGGGWPPEIDVVEMLGQEPDVLYASVHWTEGQHKAVTDKIHVGDMAQGFHTYAVDWREEEIRWYFDSRQIARAPTPRGLSEPMYLLLNLAVGGDGSWPGAPDRHTAFPARMRVDWVRAFAHPR